MFNSACSAKSGESLLVTSDIQQERGTSNTKPWRCGAGARDWIQFYGGHRSNSAQVGAISEVAQAGNAAMSLL